MQAKQDAGSGLQEQLDAEVAAHSETRGKLSSARQATERKAALLAECKARLDEAQAAAAKVGAAAPALARAEQQLKEATAALSRKDAKLRDVRTKLIGARYCCSTID